MGVEQNTRDLLPGHYSSSVASGMSDLDLGTPAEKPKGLDISPVFRIIQRNIPLIAIITIGMTAAGGYLGKQSPKSYQGGFRILVEPITSQGRSADPSAISREQSYDPGNNIDYPTLLQVLQSPELLGKIAAQVRSREPNLKIDGDTLAREIFRKNLVIKRLGETQLDYTRLIEVTYKGANADTVKLVLDELAKGYLRYSLEDRRNRIGGGIEFIEDQLPTLQKRVNYLEGALQELRQRYRLTDPDTEGTGVSKQLLDARAQRMQTERELAEQRALFARLQSQLDLTPTEALATASLSENTRLQEMIGDLKKLDSQIALKAARFTEESPALRSLLDQRKNLAQVVDAEIRRTYGSNAAKVALSPKILSFQTPLRLDLIKQLISAESARQLLEIRSRSVSQAEAELDARSQQFPAIVRQYNNLQQQLEISTKTLNQFLTQRETLRIEAAQKEVPWEVVAPPEVAKDLRGQPASAPSAAPRMMLMGLIGGLVLGFIAAFILEKFKKVFLSPADAQGALGLPAIGEIPFKRGLNQSPEPLTVMSQDPFAKSFGSLYTNLRFLTAKPVRSLVVASPGYGDGKTTVAVHLALAAAAMGQRVLLVDANLRLPEIHTLTDLPNGKGLNEVLAGSGVSWEEAVQRSSLDRNLSVLTAGEVSLDSARLLASKTMAALMQQLQMAFDLVIYDVPGVVEFSDTNFLAPNTDGILMVVGINKTKRPIVSQAMAELKKFRMPILGLVTNYPGRNVAIASRRSYDYDLAPVGEAPLLESLKVFKSTSPSDPNS